MLALTIYQPWATLITEGCKPFEFRRWPAYANLIDQDIVIHAAARKPDLKTVQRLIGLWMAGNAATIQGGDPAGALRVAHRHGGYPLASGLGVARLGAPLRCIDHPDIFPPVLGEVDPAMWAWPMENVRRWPHPIPARGRQGFWRWHADKPTPACLHWERREC